MFQMVRQKWTCCWSFFRVGRGGGCSGLGCFSGLGLGLGGEVGLGVWSEWMGYDMIWFYGLTDHGYSLDI